MIGQSTPESQPFAWTWWVKWCLSISIAVSLSATALHLLRAHPIAETRLNTLSAALLNETGRNLTEAAAVLLCIAIGIWNPAFGRTRFERIERAFKRFAGHRRQALLLAGLLPVLLRLALLPILPPPVPKVADEFGHLLIADTFASGRMANPPHPMWRHFESLYVLQQPTYASIYPFAQGMLLAAGGVLCGSPWLAVCLSGGIMCAAICWMLQGWLPPAWALLGATIAIARFSFLSYWMNSYWGGAVPAIGGALLIGSLPRVMRHGRIRDTLPLSLGLALLAQSRPFEGFLLSLPVAAVLIAWMSKTRRSRLLFPLCAAAALIAGVTFFHNWRVTGNPLLLPYQLHQKLYGTPQTFFWSTPVYQAPGLLREKDILDNFHWQLKAWIAQSTWSGLGGQLLAKSKLFWNFYLQPLIAFPLLFLPLACQERWTRFLTLTAGFVLMGIGLYPFFYYHYAAPLCCLILFAILQGLRRLRAFEWRGTPAGLTAARCAIALSFIAFLCTAAGEILNPQAIVVASTPRSRILDRLKREGGRHIILVRYGPEHLFHSGETYNGANIDASPVVWARELDPSANQALLRYFTGRTVWLFEPDEDLPRFARAGEAIAFEPPPLISAILNGAGIAASSPPGIVPGEIVTIFGRNFARDIHGAVTLGSIFWPLPLQVDKIDLQSGNVYAPVYSIENPEQVTAPGWVFFAPLPVELEKVRVQFGNIWAPIFTVANIDGRESVTVQAPFELSGESVPVTLWLGDSSAAAGNVRILPASPGIFQAQISEWTLNPVLMHPGGSFVDDDNPARHGEIVRLLVTGLGRTIPPVATNYRGEAGSDLKVLYPVTVALGGAEALVVSAKYAAGLVGVEEVAFQIPPDCATGAQVSLVIGVRTGGRTIFSNRVTLPVSK